MLATLLAFPLGMPQTCTVVRANPKFPGLTHWVMGSFPGPKSRLSCGSNSSGFMPRPDELVRLLDCYWVGSLDFNFLDISGISTKPPQS